MQTVGGQSRPSPEATCTRQTSRPTPSLCADIYLDEGKVATSWLELIPRGQAKGRVVRASNNEAAWRFGPMDADWAFHGIATSANDAGLGPRSVPRIPISWKDGFHFSAHLICARLVGKRRTSRLSSEILPMTRGNRWSGRARASVFVVMLAIRPVQAQTPASARPAWRLVPLAVSLSPAESSPARPFSMASARTHTWRSTSLRS